MATWGEVRTVAPELATSVRACFDAHIHKVIATLRRDGSPRVSGTEVTFDDDEIWLGMMLDSMKAHDLQRDPRCAIHSATVDPKMTGGDAKLSGRAIEVLDDETIDAFVARLSVDHEEVPDERFHLFRVDATEIVRTTVEGDRLVVESWHEGTGLKRVDRA